MDDAIQIERDQIIRWSQITNMDQWVQTVLPFAQARLRAAMNVCCDPQAKESDRLHATGLVSAWSIVLNWPQVWAGAYEDMRAADAAELREAQPPTPESEAAETVGPRAEDQWYEKF